jgi:hypothetical protein
MRLQLCVALTLLGCTDALRGASMPALHRPVAVAPLSTWTTSALRRPAVPSTALHASNDEGDRRLEIPEQPEYDVEGVDLKGVLKGDPVTLTLLGFGLIAFNFFVLAGFGSGGL